MNPQHSSHWSYIPKPPLCASFLPEALRAETVPNIPHVETAPTNLNLSKIFVFICHPVFNL